MPVPLSTNLTALESNLFSSGHAAEVLFTDISPDRRLVLTASADKTARLWDRKSRASIGNPFLHDAPVNCARFSPDGQRMVTSTAKIHTFRVWDVHTGVPLTDTLELGDPVASVFFSAEGSSVIVDTGTDIKWAFPLRIVRGAVPEWLPRLAEAVAGVRYNEERIEEAVPATEFLELKAALQSSLAVDPITTCAKQFLASQTLQQKLATSPPASR